MYDADHTAESGRKNVLPELVGDLAVPGGMEMSRKHLFYLCIFLKDKVEIVPHRIIWLIVWTDPIVGFVSDFHG